MTWALVTDAHSRGAVTGVRALGRGGVPVAVLGARQSDAGLWSRYAGERVVAPGASQPSAFAAAVAAVARRHAPLVVFPAQEEAFEALAQERDALPAEAILPYASWESVDAVRDKTRLADLAAGAGVRSPRIVARGRADGVTLPAELAGPHVLKARALSAVLTQAEVHASPARLRERLAELPPDEEVLVQEAVSGPLVAVALVLDRDGEVVARFQQRALRLWPAEAGPSSLGESVAPDPQLVDSAARLLRAAGFWGLAQVQFVDSAAGPAAIDVNPRFYGSLPLALAAGVNLPLAAYRVALGQPVEPPGPYRVGLRYRWLEGELTAVYNGDLARLRGAGPRPRVGAMWAADDVRASLMLAGDALVRRVRRRVA